MSSYAQSYENLRSGNPDDLLIEPSFGLCLMGGATENDSAMIWFLENANGGDVLVLRANGLGGYNDYMYSDLGLDLNSVETISFNSAEASSDPYVLQRLNEAEAIWIAGGDQSNYVNFWKDTAVEEAINSLVNERGGAVGGTSAGMAIMGEAYFSALQGTIDSDEALADPLADEITIGYQDFLDFEFTERVITETHFNDPDRIRYGRVMAFMARLKYDQDISPRAMAANEYCAITINEEGLARAWGEFDPDDPFYDDDYIYFLQENPENTQGPEIIVEGLPLTWNRGEEAVKVYKVPAKTGGENTFKVMDWETGSGGEWQDWWIEEGVLNIAAGEPLATLFAGGTRESLKVFPNPAHSHIRLVLPGEGAIEYAIYDVSGRELFRGTLSGYDAEVYVGSMAPGLYTIWCERKEQYFSARFAIFR